MGRTLGCLLNCLAAFVFFEVVTLLTLRAGCFVEPLRLNVCLVVDDVGRRMPAITDRFQVGGN